MNGIPFSWIGVVSKRARTARASKTFICDNLWVVASHSFSGYTALYTIHLYNIHATTEILVERDRVEWTTVVRQAPQWFENTCHLKLEYATWFFHPKNNSISSDHQWLQKPFFISATQAIFNTHLLLVRCGHNNLHSVDVMCEYLPTLCILYFSNYRSLYYVHSYLNLKDNLAIGIHSINKFIKVESGENLC